MNPLPFAGYKSKMAITFWFSFNLSLTYTANFPRFPFLQSCNSIEIWMLKLTFEMSCCIRMHFFCHYHFILSKCRQKWKRQLLNCWKTGRKMGREENADEVRSEKDEEGTVWKAETMKKLLYTSYLRSWKLPEKWTFRKRTRTPTRTVFRHRVQQRSSRLQNRSLSNSR